MSEKDELEQAAPAVQAAPAMQAAPAVQGGGESSSDPVPPTAPAEPLAPRRTATPATPAPAQRDEARERQAVRRGCFSIIFGAALGGLIGLALTLSVLSWLNNGLLTYNQANLNLRRQLDGEIATRQVILESQATAVNDLSTRQAAAEGAVEQTLAGVDALVSTAEADMAGLRVTAVYLETRIADAGNAADTLDAFLLGLNDLLVGVAPMGTPTATPAPEEE